MGADKTPGSEALLRQKGVYETPAELVHYVVKSVHWLIRNRFGKAAGLADRGVRVLDPAAGPANFLLAACRLVVNKAPRKGLKAFQRDHLLPHFIGYEVLPDFQQEGLRKMVLYHGGLRKLRSLEMEPRLFLSDALHPSTCGALEGGEVAVVLGNPPWRGCSSNRGSWIEELLQGYTLPDGRTDEGYFRIDGEPLGERNPKWLRDDYVKFLRLAQWLIDRQGQGIVAFVLRSSDLPWDAAVPAADLRRDLRPRPPR